MKFTYPERTSDKYYAYGYYFNSALGGAPYFVEIRGIPVEIPELPGFDLFASRGYDSFAKKPKALRGHDWFIYEGYCGYMLGGQFCKTPEDAVAWVSHQCQMKKGIVGKFAAELTGRIRSPRYGGVEASVVVGA